MSQRFRPNPRLRLVHLFILGFLLCGLTAPMAPAVAQDDPEPTADDQVQTSQQDPPVEDQPGEVPSETPPTEAPPPTLPPEPTLVPVEPTIEDEVVPTEAMQQMQLMAPAQIDVHYHVCPAGTDMETSELETACTETGEAVFDLVMTNPPGGMAYQAAVMNGRADFPTVDPDSYRLTLSGKPGWSMAAWCDVLVSDDRGNTRPYTSRKLIDSTLTIDVYTGEVISCQWFALNPMQHGQLGVTVARCPVGLETIRYDYADLRAQCSEPVSPVSIAVINLNTTASETITTYPATHAEWPNGYLMYEVPAGIYDVSPMLGDGVDRLGSVHCRLEPVTPDGSDSRYQPVPVDSYQGYRFTHTIEVDYRTTCHLFIEPVVGVELEVTKYDCAHDMVVAGANREELRDRCAPSREAVEFAIDATSLHETIATNPEVGSKATASNIPAGKINLREITPKSTMLEAVHCATTPEKDHDNPGYTPSWSSYSVETDDSITIVTEYRDRVQCEFYNLQVDEEREYPAALITIAAYGCATDMDWATASLDDLRDSCTASPGDVAYTAVAGDTHEQEAIDENGQVRFIDFPVDQGPITLTQYVDPSSVPVAVHCAVGENYERATLNGSSVTYDLKDGDRLSCQFFNHVDDEVAAPTPTEETTYGTVAVAKWTCPNGTTRDLSAEDYASACTSPADGVSFSLADSSGSRPGQTISGLVAWDSVVADVLGSIAIRESIPAGYGTPVAYCRIGDAPPVRVTVTTDGSVAMTAPNDAGWMIDCSWYNLPERPGTITVYKWDCPEGVTIDRSLAAHQQQCGTPLDGVSFTLTAGGNSESLVTTGGMATWFEVPLGSLTIAEEVPLGYSTQPYVSCQTLNSDSPLTWSAINATVSLTLDMDGQDVRCDWYNQYLGAGSISLAKWVCPAGYDANRWDADPRRDCATPLADVPFSLSSPEGTYQAATDAAGYLSFTSLQPGNYTLTETLPPGMARSFVWNCTGLNTSAVHPAPLATGTTLQVTIAAGDNISCNWMNVPKAPSDIGWLTLTKYVCSTLTYQSDINCYYAGAGYTFDLQVAQGQTWSTVATGSTNVAGQLSFPALVPGTYRLVEQGGTPCLIKADTITNDGYLGVQAGSGTTVKVFNCGKPAPSPKTPTKFPNTGVPLIASTPATEPSPLLPATALLPAALGSRRRFLQLTAAGAFAAAGAVTTRKSHLSAQQVVPLDVPATPGATPNVDPDCLHPATPEGATDETVTCARGAIPVQISIPAITVDAPIEYLDLIDGEMEQPTGETAVAWYKPTARLGERGNILLAGHLNWWGVPEAVFFHLATLVPGDVIEITGDNGASYRYVVEWREPFPAAEPPPDHALGPTDTESLTLITCGGEWDVSEAEYNQRTVVRAVREVPAS